MSIFGIAYRAITAIALMWFIVMHSHVAAIVAAVSAAWEIVNAIQERK